MTSDPKQKRISDFLREKFGDSVADDPVILHKWESLSSLFSLSSEEIHSKWEAHDMAVDNLKVVTASSLDDLQERLSKQLALENKRLLKSTPQRSMFQTRNTKMSSPALYVHVYLILLPHY